MPSRVYVVVPVKDQLHLTRSLLDQLREQGGYDAVFVFDNGSGPETASWLSQQDGRSGMEVMSAGGMTIYQMWNVGVDRALARDPNAAVAFLNNDLRLGERFLPALADALVSDPSLWAVSPAYDSRALVGVEYATGTFKSDGLAGFAFMVPGEAFGTIRFDEDFRWWYGDDDLVAQIEAAGHKIGLTGTTTVEHVNGGAQTLVTQAPAIWFDLIHDLERMQAKWGHE